MKPLKNDPELGKLVERYGELELEPSENPFERLVTSIVNQQLSTSSAEAIRQRLFSQFEIEPAAILAADPESMKEIGLSRQKIEYMKNVAEKFERENFSRAKFEAMSDEEVISELTEIKGVGTWTAKMFLMFVLAREDIFPVEDLGIRRGMEHLYELEQEEDMVSKAADWQPYRSIASLYLWKLEDQ